MNGIYYQDDQITLLCGSALELASNIEPRSVQTIVTSPPYWALRDYEVDGQLGQELTVEQYVDDMVAVFAALRPALADDGTLWLNLGDTYAAKARGTDAGWEKSRLTNPNAVQKRQRAALRRTGERHRGLSSGIGIKNLVGIPWRVAFALQADGWILRSDIIWAKPNPMPESVTDRPTKSHEYLFLLAKSPRYFYDAEAIAEPVATSTVARLAQAIDGQAGSDRVPGKTNGSMKAVGPRFGGSKYGDDETPEQRTKSGNVYESGGRANKRTVWTVPTVPFSAAHFAVYPPELIRPCILAGSRPGDTVLDPFSGSGTTGMVATEEGSRYVGIDLNSDYLDLSLSTRFRQPVLNIGAVS